MFIKMLESRRGWEDGFTCRLYEQGEKYDVADTLARSFIRKGWATEYEPNQCVSTSNGACMYV